MRINKGDLVRYGFNKECPLCEHIHEYGHAQAGRTRADACRKQLEEAMGSIEEGRERLRVYEESLTRSMAEHVERGAEQAERPEPRAQTRK